MISWFLCFSEGENDSIKRVNAPIKIELPIGFWIADIPQEAFMSTHSSAKKEHQKNKHKEHSFFRNVALYFILKLIG